MLAGTRPSAKEAGIAENDRDGVFGHFISIVRNNLHIVLCMSPVGEAFRTRCRMFPSLVNCCTIDWFIEWQRLDRFFISTFWLLFHLKNSVTFPKKSIVILLAIDFPGVMSFEDLREFYIVFN